MEVKLTHIQEALDTAIGITLAWCMAKLKITKTHLEKGNTLSATGTIGEYKNHKYVLDVLLEGVVVGSLCSQYKDSLTEMIEREKIIVNEMEEK